MNKEKLKDILRRVKRALKLFNKEGIIETTEYQNLLINKEIIEAFLEE